MPTQYTLLYRETKEAGPYEMDAAPANKVIVMLRHYNNNDACDAILEQRVRLDGEWILRSRKAFDGYAHTDAELQRIAIAAFDDLVAKHPVLGMEFTHATP